MSHSSSTEVGLRAFTTTERCELRLSPQRPLVLRRGDPDEWWLPDPSVTRSTEGVARFEVQEDSLVLIPLEPECAILLNGERIREPRTVHVGDRIRIGYTLIVLQEVTSPTDETHGLRTVHVRTEAARQRETLADEVDRLASWAESFESVRQASDDGEFAQLLLPQLAHLGECHRAVICQRADDPGLAAHRELASCGYHAGELQTILRWLADRQLGEGASAPLVQEITGQATTQRAAVGCVSVDGVRWVFILEPPALAASHALAQRGLRLLTNLLLLRHTLHGGLVNHRAVTELAHTVRLYSQPLDESVFQQVRAAFVYRSKKMHSVCRQLARAALAGCPVLILGEPGTGKQVAADAIHSSSARKHKPMISVSLAENNEELIAADLFGTVKGAFSGAVNRKGLLEAADESTLFLDEIGEISPAVQTKLLRVLERGEFRRLGDTKITKVNARLILATNRDLSEEVRLGRFRPDLYARINVVAIRMPPLRERLEDIPELVAAFLRQSNARNQREVRLTDAAIRHLQRYTWPENVRGLQNYIERAVVLAERTNAVLDTDDLSLLGSEEVLAVRESFEVAPLIEQLERTGKINQARILRLMQTSCERLPKTEFANRLQISRPVLRAELRRLVAFAMRAGLEREFFESRIAMRPEDWAEIDQDRTEA